MRIGVIYSSKAITHGDSGGAASFDKSLYEILEIIHRDGETEVLHIVPSAKPSSRVRQKSARVFEYTSSFIEKACSLNPNHPLPLLISSWGVTRLQRFISKRKIDIALIASPHHSALRIGGLPYIFTVWDLGHRELSFLPEFSNDFVWHSREGLLKNAIPRAFHVLVDTKETKDKLSKLYGLESHRASVVGLLPQAIPVSSPPQISDDYLIYPAARWPHKNHVTLLKAFAKVRQSHPSLKLVFTGKDEGNAEKIQEVTNFLGLEECVIDLGVVSTERLTSLIQHARLLLMPSLLGPSNLPPLEAELLGVPSIVSDRHTIDEYKHPLIKKVPALSVEAWAEAIETGMTSTKHAPSPQNHEDAIKQLKEIIEDFRKYRELW